MNYTSQKIEKHVSLTYQEEYTHQKIEDQHLQQQGWAAVVANLEDITRYVNNL
jgi:hypothetical protein